jgi:hypothetical protein
MKEFDLTARTSEIVNTRTIELVDIEKMPSSCTDLERMGQQVNGFFLVKGSKKMEMIYCNFFANQNGTTCAIFACYCLSNYFLFTDKQKWIGYADVKSTPVHFYVTRNSNFNTERIPVPFDLAVVNEGNAMDLRSGTFTAPRPGIYFFSFAGTAYLKSLSFHSYFYLNGNRIGSSLVQETKGPVDQYSPVTLQSTLNLKKGDRVWLTIVYSGKSSYLHDNEYHHTHFTGFMLEEEIAASL